MAETVLKVAHLEVELNRQVILRDLSFELREGETLVVLGPNGAGKTVLLRALLGLVPYRGEVSWRRDVRLGYVPQRVPLNRELPMTVADLFALKGCGREQALAALGEVGIRNEAFLSKLVGVVSSGQFQRLLVAWALVSDPDVLICDEPGAGVDIAGEETIQASLDRARARRSLSMILVTHDLWEVSNRATRVLCLHPERSFFGPPEEVLTPQSLQNIFGTDVKYFRHAHD